MSYNRAAIRRERKNTAKLAKKKGLLGEVGKMEELTMKPGRCIGFGMFAIHAHEMGMTADQICQLLETANKNSTLAGCDDIAANLTYELWRDRANKVIVQMPGMKQKGLREEFFWESMRYFIVQTCALCCQAANYLYGWSWYKTGRGKCNKVLELVSCEYLKFVRDAQEHKEVTYEESWVARYIDPVIAMGVAIEK